MTLHSANKQQYPICDRSFQGTGRSIQCQSSVLPHQGVASLSIFWALFNGVFVAPSSCTSVSPVLADLLSAHPAEPSGPLGLQLSSSHLQPEVTRVLRASQIIPSKHCSWFRKAAGHSEAPYAFTSSCLAVAAGPSSRSLGWARRAPVAAPLMEQRRFPGPRPSCAPFVPPCRVSAQQPALPHHHHALRRQEHEHRLWQLHLLLRAPGRHVPWVPAPPHGTAAPKHSHRPMEPLGLKRTLRSTWFQLPCWEQGHLGPDCSEPHHTAKFVHSTTAYVGY